MTSRGHNAARTVRRRTFLASAGAAATALAGCTGAGSPGGTSETLRVSTWSGSNETIFSEVIKPSYEDETGNTLEVTGNWNAILSKIRQSPDDDPPFDVTVGVSRTHYRGSQNDFWVPVRYDNLSYADQIKPRLLDSTIADTAVPVAYGAHAYVYNNDTVEWTPESWSDVVSDEVNGLALPSDYWLKLVMMAALIDDQAPLAEEVYDQSNMDALFEVLQSVPVETFYTGSQGLWTALSQGLATVGHHFFAYGHAKARSTDEMDLRVTVPKPTTGYTDYYQIVRGSGKRETAEEFLDFLIKPETQTAYAAEFNLGMANEETEYPDLTAENLPITNDELQQVAFQNYPRVASYAGEVEGRFRELVRDN